MIPFNPYALGLALLPSSLTGDAMLYNGMPVSRVDSIPDQETLDAQWKRLEKAYANRDKTICECCGQRISEDG